MQSFKNVVSKICQSFFGPNHNTKPTLISHAEHPVFRQFSCMATPIPGFCVNFIGQKIDPKFNMGWSERFSPDYPPVSEESFEWIATLEAVLDARDTFTMFELGAGYGRWLTSAVCAARQKNPSLKFRLLAVEPEPTHFKYLKQHLMDNGLNPSDHKLVEAALNATGEPVPFVIGHPEEWYGQQVMARDAIPQDHIADKYPGATIVQVPGVTLAGLIEDYEFVDLIDMDIQFAESQVIKSSVAAITKKVRRLYVETHSRQIHTTITGLLTRAGWTLLEAHGWRESDVLPAGPDMTQFGLINFHGGMQYWSNPLLVRPL